MGDGGAVHFGLLSQAQKVLHGNDDRIGYGHHGEAMEFFGALLRQDFPAEITKESLLIFRSGLILKPAPDRIIVVRARIHKGVGHVVVRKVGMGR